MAQFRIPIFLLLPLLLNSHLHFGHFPPYVIQFLVWILEVLEYAEVLLGLFDIPIKESALLLV